MPDTSEQWRPIPGYDGRYEVSDQGRVRSWVRQGRWQADEWKRRPEPRAIKVRTYPTGYQYAVLRARDSDGARYVHEYVHRLVLAAFVGPCPRGMEACHDDGDRAHNEASNLRWDTRSHNALDRTRHGTHVRPPHVRDARTGRFLAEISGTRS